MREDIAKKWVEALRSGEYGQTKAALRSVAGDKVGYCCLGVLCELAKEEVELEDYDSWEDFYNHDKDEVLPSEVVNWADMFDTQGERRDYGFWPIGKGETLWLTNVNDKGATFVEIADLIEKNWEQL